MNAAPTVLNVPTPASSTATSTTGSARAAGGKQSPSSTDSSFEDVMGDALDSQSKKSSNTAAKTSTTKPSADDAVSTPSTDDGAKDKTTSTEETSTLAVTTMPSQVMLALAGAVAVQATTTPAPVATTPEPVAKTTTSKTDTTTVSATPVSNEAAKTTEAVVTPSITTNVVSSKTTSSGATGNALMPAVLATDTPIAPSPTPSTSSTPTPVIAATAQTTTTQATATVQVAAAIATTMDVASIETETSATEPEKKTAVAGTGRTKIPMATSPTTGTSTKASTSKIDTNTDSTSQPSVAQADTAVIPTLEQLSGTTDVTSTSSAGTDRAKDQAMQTIRDVWSNSAFRTLAYSGDTFTTNSLSNSTSVSTEKVSVNSSEQFAEAVQNALNTPRELLPRRVEIQMQTPPGATVTLSLTRTNGELRAQFDANNEQTLQWLNGEVGRLQNMNFGLTVRWAPPQLASQQEEMSQRPAQDRQEERRREGGKRRNQQTSMDALTGVSSSRVSATAQKG